MNFNFENELKDKIALVTGGSKGVRVLTVSPGWIMTTSSTRMLERIAESSGGTIPNHLFNNIIYS